MGKRLIAVLVSTVIVLTLCWPALAAIEVKDVPRGHWAYSAVQRLLEKGYLSLYQDQTFRGDSPVDRYTFAVVVARLISEMSMLSPAAATSGAAAAPDKQDQELLKQLTTEFRDELVQLATVDESLRNDLILASKEITVLREDLNKILVQVFQVQQSVTALANSADELGQRLNSLEAAQESDVQDLLTLSNEVAQLKNEVISLGNDYRLLEQRFNLLEKKIDDEILTRTSGVYIRQQTLEKDLQRLSQEFESYRRNSEAEMGELQTRNQWLTIGAIGALILAIAK